MKLICNIPSSKSICEIEIQNELLSKKDKMTTDLISYGSRFIIITHEKIASLYGNRLCQTLSHLDISLLICESGEKCKTRETKAQLEDQLLQMGCGRDTCIIALGGGVITDISGYLAATYCRGIPLVMIPTTLLGMVDASIGGKTGVNTPQGKNMIGCIYQPKKVWIDPSTLHSLSQSEFRNGLVEMIKHGLIVDSAYFLYLENNLEDLLALRTGVLEKAIFESCRIKKEIVEQDEKDNGKRNLLNFGHTVGHALEKLSHYTLPHGEAVAIGLLVESYLAVELGYLKAESLERIKQLLIKCGLPLKLPSEFSVQEALDAMPLDKKSIKAKPRFVLINEIGSPVFKDFAYCMHVDENLIKKALDWMFHDLCHH